MKLIRTKAVIALCVITIIFVVFGIILRDNILRKIIIAGGESVFEAKVEITVLKTSLKKSSLEIRGLKIADKDDEWKNIIDIGKTGFDFRFVPLLSKKIAIEKMYIEDLRWQTARKTSGKLPPKKKKKIEKKKNQRKKDKDSLASKLFVSVNEKVSQEIKSLPVTKGITNIDSTINSFDAKKLVSEANLESYATITSLNTDYLKQSDQFKTDINNLNTDKQIEEIKKLIADAKSIKIENIQDITKAQKMISDLNAQQKSIDNTINKISSLKKDISTQFSDTKNLISQIDNIIKKDYQNMISKIKIPGIGKSNISQALFGPIWYERVTKTLHYIQLARKYMPPRKKEEKKSLTPRAKGINVAFYKKETLPTLSIKEMSISGTTGGEGKNIESPIDLKGMVKNISSDQKIYGKPTTFDVLGKKTGKIYNLNGIFDYTGDVPIDTITLKLTNFAIGELNLSKNDLIPEFKKGQYDLESKFIVKGDELDCSLYFKIKDILFQNLKTSNELEKILNEVFKSIQTIDFKAHLYGPFDNLSTKLDSNLDEIISAKIKSIYNQKIQQLQTRIKTELDQKIFSEKNKLLEQFNTHKTELDGLVSSNLSSIQEQKTDLANTINKYKQDIENKKAEEKNKAGEKVGTEIKKLFGK